MKFFNYIGCIVMVVIVMSGCSSSETGTGLLIIGHGSKRKGWDEAVRDVGNDVVSLLKKNGTLSFSVKVAFLESTPSISECISEFEKQGIRRVYVQPLFFTPSGHLNRDIPAVLGLYYEDRLSKELAEEGITVARHHMKITMGPPLSYNTVLKDILLTRISKISEDPEKEKLVILSHGSSRYREYWKEMINEVAHFICKKQGISSYDCAFVKVGQTFLKEGYPVLKKGITEGKRVLVAGLFLVRGPKGIVTSSWGPKEGELSHLMKTGRIVFTDNGILPDKRIARWVVDRVLEYENGNRAVGHEKQ